MIVQRTLDITSTTGGVLISSLPSKIRRIFIIPKDISKTLSVKFKSTDDYLLIPAGGGYDSGFVENSFSGSTIYAKTSDGSGVYIEYWY